MDIPVHMRACSLYIYHCDATTQTLKDLSTEDLCELAKHRGIDYCAPFFRQERVVGAEMLLYKKEEFVSMLKTSTGEIFISGYIRGGFIKKKKTGYILYFILLKLMMHLFRTDVNNAKALLAWERFQPYFHSESATKHVSPRCILLWRILYINCRPSCPPLADPMRCIIVLNLAEHTGSRRRNQRL